MLLYDNILHITIIITPNDNKYDCGKKESQCFLLNAFYIDNIKR